MAFGSPFSILTKEENALGAGSVSKLASVPPLSFMLLIAGAGTSTATSPSVGVSNGIAGCGATSASGATNTSGEVVGCGVTAASAATSGCVEAASTGA